MAEKEKPSVWVQFFTHAEQDEAESLKEGRAVFIEQERVRIKWPGDSKRELVALAHERSDRPEIQPDMSKFWPTWAQAFPDHYEAFRRGAEQIGSGTPLSALPVLTEGRRAELKALNIYTVEQLAGLDGAPLSRIGMNGRKFKEAAVEYLERAKGAEIEARLRAELDDMRAEMAALRKGGAAAPASAPQEAEVDPARAFFEGMEDDDLRNWLTDAGEKPHNRTGREKLIEAALAKNAENRKAAEARAAA